MRPWKLAELNYSVVKENHYEVAVLPIGATEPHNLHLPYGTDIREADIVGEEICEAAHRQGAKVLLLPTLPYSTDTNLMEFPFAMNLNPSTLLTVFTDLIDSLVKHGIRKIVLLNSHGGNGFKPVLRELYGRTPAQLFLCDWWTVFRDIYFDIFEEADDHAGEMETSFALAYFPELVARNDDGTLKADSGQVATTQFEAVNKGWVSITRPWHLLTRNAGVGNAHQATAEKGRRMMKVLVDRLAPFLVQLSEAELDDRFPYEKQVE